MPTSLRIKRGCQTQTSWLRRLLIGMYETTKCRAVGGTFQSVRTVKEHADVGEVCVLLSYAFFSLVPWKQRRSEERQEICGRAWKAPIIIRRNSFQNARRQGLPPLSTLFKCVLACLCKNISCTTTISSQEYRGHILVMSIKRKDKRTFAPIYAVLEFTIC